MSMSLASPIVILLPLQWVKLARDPHRQMEVDGDEHRWSNNMEVLNAQGPTTNATVSQEAPFAFKMAQELTFFMLAYALQSTCDGPRFHQSRLFTSYHSSTDATCYGYVPLYVVSCLISKCSSVSVDLSVPRARHPMDGLGRIPFSGALSIFKLGTN